MPSGQASTQGRAQAAQVPAEIRSPSHGGAGPRRGAAADASGRPVRNARRDGSAGRDIYSTVVLRTRGSVSDCATWHCVQTQRAPANCGVSLAAGSPR